MHSKIKKTLNSKYLLVIVSLALFSIVSLLICLKNIGINIKGVKPSFDPFQGINVKGYFFNDDFSTTLPNLNEVKVVIEAENRSSANYSLSSLQNYQYCVDNFYSEFFKEAKSACESKTVFTGSKPDIVSKTLLNDLNCDEVAKKGNKHKKFSINYFAVLLDKPQKTIYLDLSLLNTYYALESSNNTFVERVLSKTAIELISKNQDYLRFLSFLQSSYPGRFCYRLKPKNLKYFKESSIRFLVEPLVKAKYTFIMDTDIFIDRDVMSDERIFEQMKIMNISFSNRLRPGTNRLTGVMLMETEKWYTPKLLGAIEDLKKNKKLKKLKDERILYHIAYFGGALPSDKSNPYYEYWWKPFGFTGTYDNYTEFRPFYGYHFSTNRGPGLSMAADFRPEQICNLLSPSNFFTMLSSSKHLCQLFTIMSKQVTSRHINDFGPAIGTKEPICFVKNYGGGVNKCCEQCKCNEKTYLRLWNGKFGTVKVCKHKQKI